MNAYTMEASFMGADQVRHEACCPEVKNVELFHMWYMYTFLKRQPSKAGFSQEA